MDRGRMPRPEQNNLKESRSPEPERSGAADSRRVTINAATEGAMIFIDAICSTIWVEK